MHLRIRFQVLGGHTHCRVFTGRDREHLGLSGNLVMTNEEFDGFKKLIPSGFADHTADLLDEHAPFDL